mgnify:CR=1 FL=1
MKIVPPNDTERSCKSVVTISLSDSLEGAVKSSVTIKSVGAEFPDSPHQAPTPTISASTIMAILFFASISIIPGSEFWRCAKRECFAYRDL